MCGASLHSLNSQQERDRRRCGPGSVFPFQLLETFRRGNSFPFLFISNLVLIGIIVSECHGMERTNLSCLSEGFLWCLWGGCGA